jgi:hypothetical protein
LVVADSFSPHVTKYAAHDVHRRIRQTSDPEDQPADNGQQPAADVLRPEWAALQAAIREIHRSEEEHQANERNIWATQLRTAKGLNWITAIGANR